MFKTAVITLVVIGLVAGVGIAWAKNRGYCDRDFAEHVTDRIARKLDLDETQKTKLDALGEQFRALRGEWRERRPAMRDELKQLLGSETFDRARAREIIDERQQAMASHKDALVNVFAEFSDSLRPEQRTQLAEMMDRRMERRRDHEWHRPAWTH